MVIDYTLTVFSSIRHNSYEFYSINKNKKINIGMGGGDKKTRESILLLP